MCTHENDPCVKPFFCDYTKGKCTRRGERGAAVALRRDHGEYIDNKKEKKAKLKRQEIDTTNRTIWKKKQGEKGFNTYATAKMREAGLSADTNKDFKLGCTTTSDGTFKLHPYQQVVDYLLHPRVPIDRFLILHRAGSGKSLSMIRILHNYASDTRPKIIVFPRQKVVDEFYGQVMKFPNYYRDYVLTHWRKGKGQGDMPDMLKKSDLQKVKDILALKGHLADRGKEGYLAAPLVSLRYSIAGGRTVLRPDGSRPTDRVFAYYHKESDNVNAYDNKIVLMDEYHNLLRPEPDVQRWQKKLDALRSALSSASDSLIVGVTATPAAVAGDSRRMLDEIKGQRYKDATDEGFVSYFQALPEKVFPHVHPGDPSSVLPTVHTVTLAGKNLVKYNQMRRKKVGLRKLQNYGNMAGWYGYREKFGTDLTTVPYSYATKLMTVVEDVMADDRKTLVLLHRENGFRALQALFTMHASDHNAEAGAPCQANCWFAVGDEGTERQKDLVKSFNDKANAKGLTYRVAVMDAKFYSEGVDFKSVRRLVLVDVPRDYSVYQQRVGRVLRGCAYQSQLTDPGDRNVQIDMFVSVYPEPSNGVTTADQDYLQRLKASLTEMTTDLNLLRDCAVDKGVLAPWLVDPKGTTTLDTGGRVVHVLPEGAVPVEPPARNKKKLATLKSLKLECREAKLKGCSKYKAKDKADLIQLLLVERMNVGEGASRARRR
jgi:hypothetical protein